ncbi:MAG: hypothetical protein WC928_03065 [Patescibacteria group bacterium]|jgi:hypothetical protein
MGTLGENFNFIFKGKKHEGDVKKLNEIITTGGLVDTEKEEHKNQELEEMGYTKDAKGKWVFDKRKRNVIGGKDYNFADRELFEAKSERFYPTYAKEWEELYEEEGSEETIDRHNLENFSNEADLINYTENEAELYDNLSALEREDQTQEIKRIREKIRMEKQNIKKEKERKKVLFNIEKRSLSDFTKEGLQIAEEAHNFKLFLDKNNLKGLSEPSDDQGNPLTPEQIKKERQKWFNCKEKNQYSLYNEKEIEMMKKCTVWYHLIDKLSQGRLTPRLIDGKTIKYQQLEKEVEIFEQFKNENPREFARYKVETGQWEQGIFNWKKEKYKGQDCFVSYLKNREGQVTKYILNNNKQAGELSLDDRSWGQVEIVNEIPVKEDFYIKKVNLIKMEKAKERPTKKQFSKKIK